MFISRILLAAVILGSLLACGGGTTSSSSDNDQSIDTASSELYISLTDAEGDFLSYEVGVTAITLTRANGAVIDALPFATTIDFAQYVELSELLTRFSAPPGRYDSASLTLDFNQAVITVQGEDGEALAAQVVDENNLPVGELTVDIQFGDRDGFVLLPGRAAHLILDFDLDASNTITINGGSASVTVNPVLIADTILEDPKPFRVRGLLKNVYPERSAFTVDLRPFRMRDRDFGNVEVLVDEETVFEINGEYVANQTGLSELSALGTASPVVAFGIWDRAAQHFIASEVLAGTSVPWGESDALRATVVGRENNALLVRGAIVEFSDGRFTFNDELTVLVGEETRVLQARDPEADINSISVGSAIYVSGELLDDATLDASSGIVRIVPGNISGLVVSASPLAIDLSLVNGRRVSAYDFSGTGISEENDADPGYYEIATATLPLSGIDLGDPVRIRGWVSDFGSAPEDFDAVSIRNAGNVKGHMLIGYDSNGAASAITTMGAEGILFDTSEAGTRHHIIFAGIPIDLNSLQAGVPLVVPGGERGIYAISIDDRIIVSTFYSRFLELLEEELRAGSEVVRVDAQGYYDSIDNTFSSKRLRIRLTDRSEL